MITSSGNAAMTRDSAPYETNATQAAIAAGYSQHTAKQAGSRLMQRPRVKGEIARLGGINEQTKPAKPKPAKAETTAEADADDQAAGTTVCGEIIILRAPPLDGEVLPPGHVPTEIDRELAAQLSRDWMVARLMRNAMMCLGETEQTLVKIVTKTDAEGKTVVTAAQIKAFVHDAAGANAAIGQLAKILRERPIHGHRLFHYVDH